MTGPVDEFRAYLAGLRTGGAPQEAVEHLENFAIRFSEDYRIEHYYSLVAEEIEEGHIFCTPIEAETIRLALVAALPDVEVTMEGGAEYDYSTENQTATEIAVSILSQTGFVSPAEPA